MTISILASPIEFEGMKGVGNVHLTFKDDQCVYAMIGENGVGKTKCLESLFQLLFCASKTIHKAATHRSYTIPLAFSSVNKIKNKTYFDFYIQQDNKFIIKDATYNNVFDVHQMPFVFLGSQNRGYVSIKESYGVKHIGSFEQRKAQYFHPWTPQLSGFEYHVGKGKSRLFLTLDSELINIKAEEYVEVRGLT